MTDKSENKQQQTTVKRVIAGLPNQPLIIGGIEMNAYVLEDETRVLSQRGMVRGLGLISGGSSRQATKVPRFLQALNLQPYIGEDLLRSLENPILFQPFQSGVIHFGYPAVILPEICNVVLRARDDLKLLDTQQRVAYRCDLLIRALASVGIIALVDEVTGFQESRKTEALRQLVAKHLQDYARPWMKEFSDQFFRGLDKIYKNRQTHSKNRPLYYGKFISTYIYKPMENNILYSKLNELNPVKSNGYRRHRFHQFFTSDHGLRVLRDRISRITAILDISKNKNDFNKHYKASESHQRWFDFEEKK